MFAKLFTVIIYFSVSLGDLNASNINVLLKDTLPKHWQPSLGFGFGSLNSISLEGNKGLDREYLVFVPQKELLGKLYSRSRTFYFTASYTFGKFKQDLIFTNAAIPGDAQSAILIQRSGRTFNYLLGIGIKIGKFKSLTFDSDFTFGTAFFKSDDYIFYPIKNVGAGPNTNYLKLTPSFDVFVSRLRISSHLDLSKRFSLSIGTDVSYYRRKQFGIPLETPLRNTFLYRNSVGLTFKLIK